MTPHHPSPESDPLPGSEELIAYLDGELDDAQSERVERRLADDADYRLQLKQYQQSWKLLDDALPVAQPSTTFTQSTVAMVALSASQEAGMDAPTVEAPAAFRSRGWWTAAGGMLLALLVGYLFVAALVRSPERLLLRNAGVIQNLDLYRHIEDLDFLRRLQSDELLAAELTAVAGDPESLSDDASRNGDASAGDDSERTVALTRNAVFPGDFEKLTYAERRAFIEELSAVQKLALQKKVEHFRKLDAQQQKRVLALHQALSEAPQGRDLFQILVRYHEWLKSLTAAVRAELGSLAPTERLERVKTLLAEQEAERFQRVAQSRLQPNDHREFLNWLYEYVSRNEATIIATLPEPFQARFKELPPRMRRFSLVQHLGRRESESFNPSDSEIQDLVAKLSPEAARTLQDTNPAQLRELIRRWLMAAAVSRGRFMPANGGPRIDPQRLQTFFQQELTADQKRTLEAMPPEQMRRELVRMFWMAQRSRESND